MQRKQNFRIFADGACLGNPGRGGWGAIVATPEGHVTELGASEAATTNNRMELTAVIQAIAKIPPEQSGDVFTDSSYVIRGISEWIHSWKRRGWKLADENASDVKNVDLWQTLDRLAMARNLTWTHVPGHAGVPANDRCDEIATELARGADVYFYDGPIVEYRYDLWKIKGDPKLLEQKKKSKKSSSKKGGYYLSVVGGQIFRDSTWAACEARVKGRPGVKYKKCTADEEAEILRGWGVKA